MTEPAGRFPTDRYDRLLEAGAALAQELQDQIDAVHEETAETGFDGLDVTVLRWQHLVDAWESAYAAADIDGGAISRDTGNGG
jgi:hypothetical protein